ncbi:THO complex subunitB [Sesamum angolense]|uniref:THO complex subunitB n=1 Tax=Sesamum angolense TaxID=2727404 RepID=A0AAE1T4K6_9LAMI|nr:THO complex subunitB [Sesamum angolense]
MSLSTMTVCFMPWKHLEEKVLIESPFTPQSSQKSIVACATSVGVLHTKKLKQQQLAELLPPPLYIIYSQLLAQKEAFGENIELEIAGSVKDAQAFARQLANKDSAILTNLENSKLEDDVPDEEDDGQRRRKRPKKVLSKENHDQSGIYQSHPLKVSLHISDDEASDLNSAKLISLKFEFLIKLNVVCVGVEGSEEDPQNNILCNLFPDDTGLELPQQSAKLWIGNSLSFDDRRTSRPYKWAQHLAGIDVLPEVSPLISISGDSNSETARHGSVLSGLSLYRQQNRVQTVVQRIRARKKAQLALAELLDLLRKLTWPTFTCESVPWASYTPQCNLHGWLSMTSAGNSTTSLPLVDAEHSQGPSSADRNSGRSKEMETTTEDGELPSLVPVANGVTDVGLNPTKGSELENSRRLSLISKSIMSPINKGKSPSFKKPEEDVDLMLESDNELDEPVKVEETSDSASPLGDLAFVDNSWADCGFKNTVSENYYVSNGSGWYNELRAMEAEVNVHIIRLIPFDQENLILGHQVLCLAMLFDFFVDDGNPSEKRRSTSVIDVGLCKPVSGRLVSRSFRGRDRRKMISWKDNVCSPGYPY